MNDFLVACPILLCLIGFSQSNSDKQVIGIIPSRYGSTRFPAKPLALINGKTVIQRTYENAKKAKSIDKLIVATDDQLIYDHVKGFGGDAIMTSSDIPTGTDRVAEVLKFRPELINSSVIVNIQGDNPCLNPSAIDRLAQILLDDPRADMATLISPLTLHEEAQNPSKIKCVTNLYNYVLYCSRSLIPATKIGEFSPDNTYKHIGIYAFKPTFLPIYRKLSPTPLQLTEDLEQLKVLEHGYKLKAAVVDITNIDINTPEDIKIAEKSEFCQ